MEFLAQPQYSHSLEPLNVNVKNSDYFRFLGVFGDYLFDHVHSSNLSKAKTQSTLIYNLVRSADEVDQIYQQRQKGSVDTGPLELLSGEMDLKLQRITPYLRFNDLGWTDFQFRRLENMFNIKMDDRVLNENLSRTSNLTNIDEIVRFLI